MKDKRKHTVDFGELHKAMVTRILKGEGKASQSQRQAAFDNAGPEGPLGTLIDKVARCAYKVTDEDISAVKVSGASEDQIFELIVCSAVGAATRQYDEALTILTSVMNEKGGTEDAS
jgi:hypothetical protein